MSQLCLFECEVTEGIRVYPQEGVRVRLGYYSMGECSRGSGSRWC